MSHASYSAALLLAITPTAIAAGLHGHVDIGTDYVFRGILQTANGAAVNATLEYQFERGFYLGVWAGRVAFENRNDTRDIELDYFVGYQGRINDFVTIDTTIVRYTYPGQNNFIDYDWTQWSIGLSVVGRWTLRVGSEKNWLGRDKTSSFVDLSYQYPLPLQITLDLTGSYLRVDEIVARNYQHYELGVSRPIGPLQARIALVGTDSRGREIFGDRADTRWVGSISWAF